MLYFKDYTVVVKDKLKCLCEFFRYPEKWIVVVNPPIVPFLKKSKEKKKVESIYMYQGT